MNSVYEPVYGYIASNSSIVNKIRKSKEDVGSDSFEKQGTQESEDLFYAIHAFNFVKYSNRLLIEDTYDFAKGDYTGVAGVAVNTMYEAQQAGIITPYIVHIYLPL